MPGNQKRHLEIWTFDFHIRKYETPVKNRGFDTFRCFSKVACMLSVEFMPANAQSRVRLSVSKILRSTLAPKTSVFDCRRH